MQVFFYHVDVEKCYFVYQNLVKIVVTPSLHSQTIVYCLLINPFQEATQQNQTNSKQKGMIHWPFLQLMLSFIFISRENVYFWKKINSLVFFRYYQYFIGDINQLTVCQNRGTKGSESFSQNQSSFSTFPHWQSHGKPGAVGTRQGVYILLFPLTKSVGKDKEELLFFGKIYKSFFDKRKMPQTQFCKAKKSLKWLLSYEESLLKPVKSFKTLW